MKGREALRAFEGWDDWRERSERSRTMRQEFRDLWAEVDSVPLDNGSRRWLESIDPLEKVGKLHHTVPKFLLRRWSVDDQVLVHSRISSATQTRNIDSLAQRDFYTFIDDHGQPNASFEVALSDVEDQAAPVIANLLNPLVRTQHLGLDQSAVLAMFAAFQVVRTPRRRREAELQAEWYYKTMAQGRVPEDELATLDIAPHQNDLLATLMPLAYEVWPMFLCRPVSLFTWSRGGAPTMFIGDEPVIIDGDDDAGHHPDCYLSEEEEARRAARARRTAGKGRRHRHNSRIVHMAGTRASGLGTATALALPISPRAVLVWGELQPDPWVGAVGHDHLDDTNATTLVNDVNEELIKQSLDWIVTRPDDEEFLQRTFAPRSELIRVCDTHSAASTALNQPPSRPRPQRLRR